jgi:hypothetical protein
MTSWKLAAASSAVAFALSVGFACTPTPAAPPGPAACNNQPAMAQAIDTLERAHGYLERAEQNKDGWRDAAIQATKDAIQQTITGCQFADTH